MKYLQDYMTDRQTIAFDEAGAFFAFGNEQFNKAKVEGVEYTQLMGGLICPLDKAKQLLLTLCEIHTDSIAQDIAENGLVKIIKRELNNHEAYYTGDTTDTAEALDAYMITPSQVQAVFRNKKLTDKDLVNY